ncbi:MAG: hypothetical protein JWM68_546 [Verrucomicrobiales bacterium]|nr:hypothetical protein [Verrucomicrobiales bacterium]
MKKLCHIILVLLSGLAGTNAAELGVLPVTNHTTSRVVVVEDPKASRYFLPQAEALPKMIERGLNHLPGQSGSRFDWNKLISSNDVVGIKVFSAPGRTVGTRPEVVGALIENMLAAGISPKRIVIWDKRLADLYTAGFAEIASRHNVRMEAATATGWDDKSFYENAVLGKLTWGDLEFDQKEDTVGRKSYVSKLLTKEITKIISVAPLLNHNSAGVTGHLYNLSMGSVDNSFRFESSVLRLSSSVPEIYALPQIGDRVILCVTDGLICQYQGQNDTLLHYATSLNQIWFSTDPVAADTLAINELDAQRRRFNVPEQKLETDLYKNATLLELGACELKKIAVERVR